MDLPAATRTLKRTTERRLTYRLAVERDANADTEGPWGQPAAPDWQPHLAGVHCRIVTSPALASEPVDDSREVVFEDRRVWAPLGTDVTERDRVASITDRSGAVILEGPINIEGVMRFDHHIELVLERIR